MKTITFTDFRKKASGFITQVEHRIKPTRISFIISFWTIKRHIHKKPFAVIESRPEYE